MQNLKEGFVDLKMGIKIFKKYFGLIFNEKLKINLLLLKLLQMIGNFSAIMNYTLTKDRIDLGKG